jgi:SPP1 gp7 family putative phage head morphogenesis protein
MAKNADKLFREFSNVNAIDLARVEAGEVRRTLSVLEDLESDLVRTLQKEAPSIRKQRRIGDVRRAVEDAINDGYSVLKANNRAALAGLAKASSESTVAILNRSVGATVFNPILTEQQIAKLANAEVMFGRAGGAAKIGQWWDGQRDDFKVRFGRQLRLGYALGEGVDDISKRLIGTEGANFKDGTTSVSKRNAEILTRTSVQAVSNEARLATFAGNSDVVKGVEWLATLDDRTCPVCQALDGLAWEMNADGSIGSPIGHSKAYPGSVAHFQCRCTTVARTRSWEELNGSAEAAGDQPDQTPAADPPTPRDEADTDPGEPVPSRFRRNVEEGIDPSEPYPIPTRKPKPIRAGEGSDVGGMTAGEFEARVRARMAKDGVDPAKIDKAIIRARASMDGQVGETLDFDAWLRKQSDARRLAILGPSRKELFDRGVITTRDMTDQANRPLTVAELVRKSELGLFAAAETEGIRQAFTALTPGAISPFVKPDRAAEIQRAAAARIEDTVSNPAGREILAGELSRVLNESGALRRSPAENYARAFAAAEVREEAARKANTLRNARARIIRGDRPTKSQSRVLATLTPAEKKNFEAWAKQGGASSGSLAGTAARAEQAKIDELFPPANPVGRDTFDRFRVGDGFTAERAALHEEIIEDYLSKAKPVKKPVALMTGGGPASGKSVLTRDGHVPTLKNAIEIDSDEIKKALPEYRLGTKIKDPAAAAFAHEESSYLSKEILRRSAESKRNVFLDGTGDSSFEKLKAKATALRAGGAELRANYVTVDTIEAIRRNEARAAKTGRMVPNSFVSETHANISRIFPRILDEKVFDDITLWDTNTPGKAIRVISQKNGVTTIHDQGLWERFLAKANE